MVRIWTADKFSFFKTNRVEHCEWKETAVLALGQLRRCTNCALICRIFFLKNSMNLVETLYTSGQN